MRLQLLHGPAIESSRNKLSDIRAKFDSANIVVFDSGANVAEILESIQTVSMFDGERLVVIEQPAEDLLPALLTVHSDQLTIVLWLSKEVDTKKYPGFQVFFFPEGREISVFPFLRLLGSRSPQAFTEMKKLKEAGFENQYFITMILYLLRNLVVTPKKAADFVRDNNEKMRQNFTTDELINLYKSILEIDCKIKKGFMEVDQADFSLVSGFLN